MMGECISQEELPIIFHLDSISKQGIKLDKGWKFHPGDDSHWAKMEYDDKTWQRVDPTLQLHQLPMVKEAGIGWFRLKIQMDSSLLNERVTMVVTSSGASEIYLNEELIYRFGKVSSNYEDEQTRIISRLPLSLKFGSQPTQQLAIRYSFHKKNVYMNFANTPSLQLILKENNQAFIDYTKQDGFYRNIWSIHLSLYLPLGLLFLFLYYSYRFQKEYLCMGFFFLSMFLGMVLQIIARTELATVNQFNFLLLAQQGLGFFGMIIFLNGLYILFKQNKSRIYYLIVIAAFMVVPAFLFFNKLGLLVSALLVPIIVIEYLRSSLKAFRYGRPGAFILVITSILCLMLMMTTVVLDLMSQNKWAYFSYSVAFLLPPIGLAVFFAGEFARTGLALRSRVAEVEQLSEKTIAQEKEKQQILASQNLTLEAQVIERTTELVKQRQALEIEKEGKLLAEFNRKFSESELKALRSQMNPHFVFNILNTIESYALENNKEGVSLMIQKFSRLTRLVLENSMNQLVLFQNDWKSLQLYVELEQMRYADDFRVVYHIENRILDGEYFIPPMIIQPFVENAIIHGLRNKADHYGILNLSASIQDGYIIVEVQDNGIGRTKAAELKSNNPIQKSSLGIRLTQDRISIFNNLNHNRKVNVTIEDLHEGTKVTIAMPAN